MIHFFDNIAASTQHVLLRIKTYVHSPKEDRNSPVGFQLLYQLDIEWWIVKRYSQQVFKGNISIVNYMEKWYLISNDVMCLHAWRVYVKAMKLPLSLQHFKMKSTIVFNFKQWLSVFNCKLCNWSNCSKDKTMFPKAAPKTLCSQFHCLSLLCTVYEVHMPSNSAAVLSYSEKYWFHWYAVFHLNIPSLPLLSHHLAIHPSKYAWRFSTLATGHKGMVHLSTQYLLCRCI